MHFELFFTYFHVMKILFKQLINKTAFIMSPLFACLV